MDEPTNEPETPAQSTQSEEPTTTTKELEIDGYKFTIDTDLLDDVEAFEIVDRIENKKQVGAVVPLLHFMIGKEGYDKMKAHFVEKDGKFRVTKLMKVYEVIVENFNPKG